MSTNTQETLKKLQYLSTVKKVTSELVNHIGIEDSVLAEFIIDMAIKSDTEKSFSAALLAKGAEFEKTLITSLFRIIKSMLPNNNNSLHKNINNKTSNNSNDTNKTNSTNNNNSNDNVENKKFPGLSIPNSKPIPVMSQNEKRELRRKKEKEKLNIKSKI